MTCAVRGLQVSTAGRALVHDVTFTLTPGRSHALIGVSGSGKSLTGLALAQVLPMGLQVTAGEATVDGRPLQLTGARVGQGVCFVPQDAQAALNPVLRVEDQLIEAARLGGDTSEAQARTRALQQLTGLGVDDPEVRLRQWPHQLSGGLRQRVLIAAALLTRPRVLCADEPTAALDASVRFRLVRELLNSTHETLLLLTTHDLAVARCCDDVSVMHEGKVVESGPVTQVLQSPVAAATQALLAAETRALA